MNRLFASVIAGILFLMFSVVNLLSAESMQTLKKGDYAEGTAILLVKNNYSYPDNNKHDEPYHS